jgi:hypothetical protein
MKSGQSHMQTGTNYATDLLTSSAAFFLKAALLGFPAFAAG